MKKEYKILVLIIVLAYVLRILPYLLGYPIPITDDSLKDFQQVKYLIENQKINFSTHYGSFPILHLLVFGISKLGFDPMRVFLFFPQIFASLGIFFFFLFLKKYFSVKKSLFTCFLIAVFGPHIYWSSQPVRETIGLFFFPLIIYLFDREITSPKSKISNKILLFSSFTLMVLTHSWSTFMILGSLFFAALFFYKEKLGYRLSLIVVFSILTLIYWSFFFPFIFKLTFHPFNFNFRFLILLLFAIGVIFFLRRFDLNNLKKPIVIAAALVIILFSPLILKNFLVFRYPIQILTPLALFLILILIGFFYSRNKKMNNLFKINIFYFILFLIVYIYCLASLRLAQAPFDILRVLEFAIFPCSIIASFGFFLIEKKLKYLLPLAVLILIFLGTLIYPPIFIYKNNFESTPLYDIRSDLRYIPPQGFELIARAHSQGYSVKSNNQVINEYQNTFYPEKDKKLILISKQDYRIKKNYEKVRDEKLGIPNPENLINKTINLKPIYSNDWGGLYKIEK